MHSRSRLSKGQGKLVLFSAISPKIGCEADYKEARSFIIALKFLYHFPALTGVSSLVTVGYLTSPCIFVLHHSWKNRLILLRSRQSSMLDTQRMKWSYKENDIQRPNPVLRVSAVLRWRSKLVESCINYPYHSTSQLSIVCACALCFLLQISSNIPLIFRFFCETTVSHVFFWNFAREIGPRLTRINPLTHARR